MKSAKLGSFLVYYWLVSPAQVKQNLTGVNDTGQESFT
jgi:hypothetical protein